MIVHLQHRAAAIVVALGVASLLLLSLPSTPRGSDGRLTSVVVLAQPAAVADAQAAIRRLGGAVVRHLPLVSGMAARVPAEAVHQLQRLPAIRSVTPDVTLTSHHSVDGYDATAAVGSLHNTARLMKTMQLRQAGLSGAGVDVALIDTGVAPVDGLLAADDVLAGPDFSAESGDPARRSLDGYGHGTHLAGIITAGGSASTEDHDGVTGLAPRSRIVNVKVGGASGATDVSQVLAALDWVVQHRSANGMNIRVVNLAFGTNGVQDRHLDPLSYAVEMAWRRGLVVVVAAGNAGKDNGQLSNPAYNPYVLAVGADDTRGTMGLADDIIPPWSSRGDGVRNPDVVAPGTSIASLRVPGSHIDEHAPAGIVNARLTKGSGTSQAAAATSAGVALLLELHPTWTPDQVKHALRSTSRSLPSADPRGQGAGLVDFSAAAHVTTPAPPQTWPASTGTGSLDAARGDVRVAVDGVELAGEQTVWGGEWDGAAWAADLAAGSSWSGSSWSGSTWTSGTWAGSSWSGSSWSGSSWSGSSWSGSSWSGSSWSGSSWSGSSWSGSSWSGSSWSTAGWLGASWG